MANKIDKKLTHSTSNNRYIFQFYF